MATIKILLHPINKDKEGRRKIVLRLTVQRIKYYLDLGIDARIFPDEFADMQIKPTAGIKQYKQINSFIAARNLDAHEALNKIQLRKLPVTLETFRKYFNQQKTQDFVFPYFDSVIENLRNNGKAGNAAIYLTVRNSFEKFARNTRLRFCDLDATLLRKYEEFLSKEQLKGNAKSTYFRTLRATYNRAIGDDLADVAMYPFKNMLNPRGFKISSLETKTIKRAISIDDLKKLIEFETKPLTRLHDAKLYFTFLLITRGMNFTDLAHLTKDNIANNQIIYLRAKTRHTQQATIEILPQMAEILKYFSTHPETTDHLFPILNSKIHKTALNQKHRIQTRLKRINKQLLHLAELAGLKTKVTTYTARHSWATLAKMTGEQESLISEGLLHDNVQTTQIYLQQFENKLINEMNKRIIDNLFK